MFEVNKLYIPYFSAQRKPLLGDIQMQAIKLPRASRSKLNNVPAELKGISRWICWKPKLVTDKATGNSKITKVPIGPLDGREVGCDNLNRMSSFDVAIEYYMANKKSLGGIGFVFNASDNIIGIDIDHARNVETGEVSSWAKEILEKTASYAEISPSGTGFHIICRADWPFGDFKKKKNSNVEIFNDITYFTITGDLVGQSRTSITEENAAIKYLAQKYFSDDNKTTRNINRPITQERLSEDEIIRRACMNPDFEKLWNGGFGGGQSHSEADMSLCCHLAFWTDGDAGLIESLWQQSMLWRPEKCENRKDYVPRTIKKAIDKTPVTRSMKDMPMRASVRPGTTKTAQPGEEKPAQQPKKPPFTVVFQGCTRLAQLESELETADEPIKAAFLSILNGCDLEQDQSGVAQRWMEGLSAVAQDGQAGRICETIRGEACERCPLRGHITSPTEIREYHLAASRLVLTAYSAGENAKAAKGAKDKAAEMAKVGVAMGDVEIQEGLAEMYRSHRSLYVALKGHLNAAGLSKTALAEIEHDIKAIGKTKPNLRLVNPKEFVSECTVRDLLGDDSPAPDLIVPLGYSLKLDATTKTIMERIDDMEIPFECTIAHAALLLCGQLKDQSSGYHHLLAAWFQQGRWNKQIVARSDLMNARKIPDLSSFGFPSSSENAKDLVRYIVEFEAANSNHIPALAISSTLGWQGKDGYLWGKRYLDGHTRRTIDVTPDSSSWSSDAVAFFSDEEATRQLTHGYHPAGTWEGWCKTVAKLVPYPKAMLMVYTSLVPPILSILECPNFVADLGNRTSTGKTTALKAGASVWGRPSARDPNGLIDSWNMTPVGFERSSAVRNHLPMFLDDTKEAKNEKLIADIIYASTHGRGRIRGSRTGMASTGHWHHVLLSTGEQPATYYTQDGGTRTRCMVVRGMPFGATSKAMEQFTREINAELMENYGHAGPRFVECLIKGRKSQARWIQAYKEYQNKFAEKSSTQEGGRLAAYAAAIHLAFKLFHSFFHDAWEKPAESPIRVLWDAISKEAGDASGEGRALNAVMDWAWSHEESFLGRHQSINGCKRVPNMGWAGRWDNSPNWDFIAFNPDKLREILRDRGFSPEAIIKGWKELGWLDHDKNHDTKPIRADSKVQRYIVITKAAMDRACDIQEAEAV